MAKIAAICAAAVMMSGAAIRADARTVEVEMSSKAAVLYEPSGERVLYEKAAHTALPMASTTKLMTALIAAETLDWEQTVTATEQAVRVEGSALGLHAGDTLTVRDLVTGLLLASGNDAANVVALTVCDSLEAFAVRMNRKAEELGMRDSRFVTPSGLDADGHGASAYDMARLAAAVLEQPVLAEICAAQSAQIRINGVLMTVSNHNRLLKLYPDAIGMKTGYTEKAGKCLVSAAKRDGVTLIAVTLNGGDYWNDHIRLYEAGFACVRAVTLPQAKLSAMPVAGGMTSAVALTADAPTVVLETEQLPRVQIGIVRQPFIWAPVQARREVGTAIYRIDGQVVATVPIYTTEAVAERAVAGYTTQVWRAFVALCRELIR